MAENIQQNNPANATVVNFGVSFLHLSETENIAVSYTHLRAHET